MPASTARKIKSAGRTLALFEFFSRHEQPFTVGRIAKGLDIPQPSVSMLLRYLQELGYLDYDPKTRTFRPSIRVALLGAWVDRQFGDDRMIGPRLARLQERIGENAFIGIQTGAATQYVLSQQSRRPDRLNVSSGSYRSLTCSAMGRALLSLMPDAEVMSWVRRCNAEAKDERFRVREREFLELITEVRTRGYAETAGDSVAGHGAIAMTFSCNLSQAPLAVGIGGPLRTLCAKKDLILEALSEFVANGRTPQERLTTELQYPGAARARDVGMTRAPDPAQA